MCVCVCVCVCPHLYLHDYNFYVQKIQYLNVTLGSDKKSIEEYINFVSCVCSSSSVDRFKDKLKSKEVVSFVAKCLYLQCK